MPGNWEKTIVQTIFEISPWKNILTKKKDLILYIMKNLTDFCKTVETGVDPRLAEERQTDHVTLFCSCFFF